MPKETIHTGKIPGRQRLYLDFLYDPDRTGAFFQWPHATTEAFQACTRRVLDRRVVDRESAAEVLLRQNAAFGAPDEAMRAAEELRRDDAVVVFTGQQAGLFGGPLYTIYKSLALVGWAERLRAELGCPVIPVFWIAADDHDFEEIRWAGFPDRENRVRRLRLDIDGLGERVPASQIRLGNHITDLLGQFRSEQIPTEFSEELWEALETDYAPNHTMVYAFGRWMARLMGRFGLVVFDPSDPAAKNLCRSLFAEELDGHALTAAALADIECRLEEAGYHRQVAHPEGHSHLFFVDNGRHALHAADGQFWIDPDGADQARPLDTWLKRIEKNPAAFSPGVLFRPVAQSYLFPVIGAVCGPSEIAYWAQARALFDRFGQVMPVVLPRSTATITERKITSAVAALDHTVCDFFGDVEALINAHFERSFPGDLEAQFAAERTEWKARLDRLKGTVVAFEPTLAKSFDVGTGRMLSLLDHLQKKVFQAHKRKGDEIRGKFYKLAGHLYPEGRQQERVFNVAYYLNKYGFGFLDRVKAQLKVDTPDHQVIEP